MIENEEKQPMEATEAISAPIGEGTGAARRRRRRRPGNHRKKRPAAAAGSGVPEAEIGPEETAALEESETGGEELDEESETETAGVPASEGSTKRRRRRRGGRRHRRRGTGPGEMSVVGTQAAVPAASAAGEAAQTAAETSRPAAMSEAPTPPQPKEKENRRLPAPAPDSAPAEPSAPIGITKLGVRHETDAYRVMKFPGLDAGRAKRLLIQFLQEQREKTGIRKAVLGLSGGLDSAVSAAIAVEALGPENVTLYFFADGQSNQAERERASQVANRLRRSLEIRDIRPQLDAFFTGQGHVSPQRRRQRASWEWMAVLYDQAALQSVMVITTSNKTKRLLGYGADFGQNGYSVNLVGDLYQSQVRELARVLNLPGFLMEKGATSLSLDELGFGLQETDGFLYQIVDVRVSLARLLDLGVEEEKLRRIYRRIKESAFRRALAPVAESQNVYVPRGWNAAR